MDEKIKNIIDERMEVWGYLKSRYTGKMEEMLVIYQETCKAIISENINTAKDNRMGIIREERKGIPVTPAVSVPKRVEQKNLNNVKKTEEGWENTKKAHIKKRWIGGRKYLFKNTNTDETWEKEFTD